MLLENILEQVSPKTAALAIVGLLVLLKLSSWIAAERKISALGGRGAQIRSYVPGGSYNLFLPSVLALV
jgi:hypothetical protein